MTPEKVVQRARRLRKAGHSTLVIAAKTGISKSAAYDLTADMGIDARPAANRARAAVPPKWLKRAQRLVAAGASRNEAAAALGVPKSTLYRVLQKFGDAPPQRS